LIITQINAGQLVVLQGMRKLKFLAKANVAGNTVGLFTAVPLYYFWGLNGIVPAIILSAFMTLFFSWYFSSKVGVKTVKVEKASLFSEGGDMIKMGFFLSLSSLIATSLAYVVRIFISHTGGVEEVGFYNAGLAIIHSYVGLVFTAMSTDYFPRLSGIVHDREKTDTIINHQAEIALLILAPILTIFLIYIKYVVILLYSNKFLPIESLIHWAILGTFLKAASWPLAYLFIAKGDTKLFFYSELTNNIYILGLRVAGYVLYGLEGLGISFLLGYLIYFIQVFLIARIKYTFNFNKNFYRVFSIQFLFGILCLGSSKLLDAPYSFIFGTIIIIASFYYSVTELNKRMNIMALISQKFKRKDNS
jgi:O-antigen/teichoic acid export membrane protein